LNYNNINKNFKEMKKLLLVVAAFAFSINVFAQGIEFEHGTFDEALTKAKAENKMIFMDCYAVWCAPCKFLSTKVFVEKEVGDFFNANFINVKIDMESGEGVELKKKYNVKAYPTLLWLDANGNMQHKELGAISADALIEQAKNALDPDKKWKSVVKQFEEGERDLEFLRNYIITANRRREDISEAAKAYYAQIPNEKLFKREEVKILALTIKSTKDEKFAFVLKNKEKFYDVVEKNVVDWIIDRPMRNEYYSAMNSKDKALIEAKKKELLALDKTMANKIFADYELQLLYKDPDKNKYFEALYEHTLKFSPDDSEKLNSTAWRIIDAKEELSNDLLKKALNMAKHSVELNENYANLDTYALGLYKTGKIDEANKMAKKSVDLATDEEKKNLWSLKLVNGEL